MSLWEVYFLWTTVYDFFPNENRLSFGWFGPLRAILFPDGATHAWSVVPCPILIHWYMKAVYPRKLLTCSGRVAGHQCEPLYYSVCMIACVVFQASLRLCEFFEMPRNCVVGGCTRNSKANPDFQPFKFPKHPATCREWVRFVNTTRSDFKLSEWSRICRAHFDEDSQDASSWMKQSLGLQAIFKLRTGAVQPLKATNKA